MLIKTLLNKLERFKSFVYKAIQVEVVGGEEAMVIDITPRSNSRPLCPECGLIGAYDAAYMTGNRSGCSSICRHGRSRPIFAMRPAERIAPSMVSK